MSLRHNALVLAVLTVLMAIIGAWSGDPDARAAVALPLACCCSGWPTRLVIARAGLAFRSAHAKPRAFSGVPPRLQLTVTHRLARELTVEIAADAPASCRDGRRQCDTLVVPAAQARALSVARDAARLGQQMWPPLRARVAGPLGLAWWTRPLPRNSR